jgi:hypothetical protein
MVLVYHTYGILSIGKLKKVSIFFIPKGENIAKNVSPRTLAKHPPFRWAHFQGLPYPPPDNLSAFGFSVGKH